MSSGLSRAKIKRPPMILRHIKSTYSDSGIYVVHVAHMYVCVCVCVFGSSHMVHWLSLWNSLNSEQVIIKSFSCKTFMVYGAAVGLVEGPVEGLQGPGSSRATTSLGPRPCPCLQRPCRPPPRCCSLLSPHSRLVPAGPVAGGGPWPPGGAG